MHEPGHRNPTSKPSTAALTLLALGIVYGDIGTSPLYAVKETFAPAHGIPLTHANLLGGLSAIFWALMIVVSLKYVTLVMRADNRGEGGIMALLALASAAARELQRWRAAVLVVGVFGASLFYGEAILTPAISVLSAVEGLEIGTAMFKPWILPIAIGVITALFLLQRHGTAAVGTLFGPVCVAWFLAIGAVGVWNIAKNPAALAALDPRHAFAFILGGGLAHFLVLGAVLLAVTGAEALYADMGHFGKRPIRIAWFGLVAPALVLNYFGQGALIMADPKAVENPFYLSVPGWALYPMVALATAATVIASQATISAAYSLTQQAIQLGYLPRLRILHTSAKTMGQIYIPAVNWALLAAVLAAVIGFGSSSQLAHAYGVSVIGTMLSTTFLTFFVIRYGWHYPLALCLLATGLFALVDAAFLVAAMSKLKDGAWFPLVAGAALFTVMVTWRKGREILARRQRESAVPLAGFLESLFAHSLQRVPGTAVFLTPTPDATPHALMHNLNHNKVLHERVIFLTIEVRDVPWVPFEERVSLRRLGHGCHGLVLRYGFMNRPDVPQALEIAASLGLDVDMMDTSFFLSREILVPVAREGEGMALWRERLFAAMARNAGNAADYFNIPANRVIELGTRIEI
ncbi:MAG: potassium transporter Kup [Burkholderiales bacterium]